MPTVLEDRDGRMTAIQWALDQCFPPESGEVVRFQVVPRRTGVLVTFETKPPKMKKPTEGGEVSQA